MSEDEVEIPAGEMNAIKKLVKTARANPVTAPTEAVDRITGQLSMHFQQHGEMPLSGNCNFSFNQKASDEPAFQRWQKFDEEWKQVETGWVDAVGYILLESRVGKGLNVNPSSEQKEEFTLQVIEVSAAMPLEDSMATMIIKPGCAMMAEFTKAPWIRCRKGTAKVNVTVFPSESS